MEIDLGGEARGPLAGIRVLDFSTVLAGPLCTQILGDLGADVIKVEAPAGDTTRRFGAPKNGLSAFFAQINRNKRSVGIDLKNASGREVAARLARDRDVVIVSLRPGVADRIGIGYEALSSVNPKLVYAAVTGFGDEGPYAGQPAYDTVIQGLVGFMPVQGHGKPAMVASAVADKTSALTAAYGIIAALFARERDGRGQRIEIPMLDSYAAFILPDCLGRETFLPEDPDYAVFDVSRIHRTWPTADGHVVFIIIEDHQFAALCGILDHPELATDPRYQNLAGRMAHLDDLFGELEATLVTRTTAELVETARANGVPLAPVNAIRDFLDDPQAQANGTFLECEDADAGRLRLIRNPVRFGRGPAAVRRMPPRYAADTAAVLAEAGYDASAIADLREKGAIT